MVNQALKQWDATVHKRSECQDLTGPELQVSISAVSVKSEESLSHSCTYKGCKVKEFVPVLCPSCEKQFCLGHRHQSDHDCEKLEVHQPRMAATQQLVKDIIDSKQPEPEKKGGNGAKSSATAAKVSLMKLKMRAAGNSAVPQGERVYFQVFLPKEVAAKAKPMFFSSKWSVGKVVDFAASAASIRNDNNRSDSKKLRLCHPSGEVLPLDLTLDNWMSNTVNPLFNGGFIILEYLDNDCEYLKDADTYF